MIVQGCLIRIEHTSARRASINHEVYLAVQDPRGQDGYIQMSTEVTALRISQQGRLLLQRQGQDFHCGKL